MRNGHSQFLSDMLHKENKQSVCINYSTAATKHDKLPLGKLELNCVYTYITVTVLGIN